MTRVAHQSQNYDTLTRTEALRERGYPPEVVNGNGSAVAKPLPAEVLVPEVLAPGVTVAESGDAEIRRCSECGGPIPSSSTPTERRARRRARTNERCASAGSRNRERSPRKRAGLTAEGGPKRGAANAASLLSEPGTQAARAAPATTPELNLCGLLESLAGQLGAGWKAEVALSEVTLSWRPAPSGQGAAN